MDLMEQFKYEKLTDDLYYFGNYIVLRFNIDLGRKDKDGFRVPYHSEFNYKTSKYPNVKTLTTLRRSFDYYLTLENTRHIDGVKEYVQIRLQDMILLRMILDNVFDWFYGKDYKGLFKKEADNKIHIKQIVEETLDGLVMDKYIRFEPIVLVNNEREDTGVRLYLSSESNFVDMTIEKLAGFKYLIDSINMYESAQIMLNYIPQVPYGTNAIVFEDDYIPEEQEGAVISKVNNRTIPSTVKNNSKSFFAKIDEI